MATPAPTQQPVSDDLFTVSAIAALATILASFLHEGVGHAAVALATGAESGLLTAVAWSSEFDSRLVAAGGTCFVEHNGWWLKNATQCERLENGGIGQLS